MTGQGIAQFIPLILIFVIFYFFLIRPQQKRVKDHKAMVESLKRGDEVITSGGIIGVVDRVVKEPLGGAHRDKKKSIEEVKKALIEEINSFKKIDRQKIKELRSEKYINMGSLSNL